MQVNLDQLVQAAQNIARGQIVSAIVEPYPQFPNLHTGRVTTTGFINGPTQVGTYNFVVTATDSGSPAQTATANDFIQIRTGPGRNDTVATATLGNSAN